MHVGKWGNSLSIRLPAAVVKALDLAEGDDVAVRVVGAREMEGGVGLPGRGLGLVRVVGAREMEVERKPGRAALLARLAAFEGRLPADFIFDRDGAPFDRGGAALDQDRAALGTAPLHPGTGPRVAERPCVDSNVLVYAVAGQGEKRRIALGVVGQGASSPCRRSAKPHVLRRKAGMSLEEVAEALAVVRAMFEVVPLTVPIHERALRVAQATGYSIWDATMVAAALDAGCDELVSEDMQGGRRIDGLTMRDPFAAAAAG